MKYILPSFLFLVLFSACSKDENDPPTNEELLASGTWKFDEGGVDNDQNGTVDLIVSGGLLDPCIADNTITFSTTGTGVIDEGGTKCDPSANQSTNFNYTLSTVNNQTQITLAGADLLGLGGSFEIIELSDTRLGLSKDTSLAPFPMPVSLIVYLKH